MKFRQICIFLFLIFINLNAKSHKKNKTEIFIFIHGTIGPLTSLPTTTKEFKELFGRTEISKQTKLTDNILSRFYQRYINQCRLDGIHKYQPISNLGLIKFGEGENKKQLKIFETIFNQNLKNINRKNKYSFYTFGWDGSLNTEKRKHCGEVLYKELIKIFNNKENIHIYAHSHGGSVALNLASAEKKLKNNLKIKNLILLGTPIQQSIENLIHSPIFENIYNFYSTNDYLQILEDKLLITNKSKRKFTKNLPKNLKQIEIQANKQKPNHWELWFWGKTHSNIIQNFIYRHLMYRNTFILYPYPILVFIPQIIEHIKKDPNLEHKQEILLNIKKIGNFNDFQIKMLPIENMSLQIKFQ